MRIVTWNVCLLYRAGAMNELVKEMEKYKIDLCAVQEIRWPGKGMAIKRNTWFYIGHKNDKHKFGTWFYVRRYIMDNLLDFEPINEIICKFRVKFKYYNLSLISTHAPNKKKIN